MRVLHLIDLRDDALEARAACRAAVGIRSAAHRVIGVGSNADAARVRDADVPIDAVAPAIGPLIELGSRRMKRLISDRDGTDASRPWADVVQCWSPELLGMARLASGQRTPPRVCGLLRPPVRTPAGLDRLRLEFGFRFASTFAFDRHVRSTWAEIVSARRGGRELEQDIRLLSPPRPSPFDPRRRSAARAALGLHAQDIAIGLLADPPGAGHAAAFAFLLGLVFTTGARLVGIVRQGDERLRRASRFIRLHGRRWGLVVARSGGSPGDPFDACDLAVWLTTDSRSGGGGDWSDPTNAPSGPLLMLDALARGIPVVAAGHPTSDALFSPSFSADDTARLRGSLLARDQTLNAVADRLLPLLHDQAHRRAIAETGRRWALRPTWGDAFEDDLPRLWREVTNTPVARPGLPAPTALLEGAA